MRDEHMHFLADQYSIFACLRLTLAANQIHFIIGGSEDCLGESI